MSVTDMCCVESNNFILIKLKKIHCPAFCLKLQSNTMSGIVKKKNTNLFAIRFKINDQPKAICSRIHVQCIKIT